MILLKKGITVGQLQEILRRLPKNKPFVVSSDEEQNCLFKGVYLEHYEDFVVIAGLSGFELEGFGYGS